MLSYRGGSHHRVYSTAVNELDAAVKSIKMGIDRGTPLCRVLRSEKEERLFCTYADKVFILKSWLKQHTETGVSLPPPLYNAVEGRLLWST
jgi:hypothetical protein